MLKLTILEMKMIKDHYICHGNVFFFFVYTNKGVPYINQGRAETRVI